MFGEEWGSLRRIVVRFFHILPNFLVKISVFTMYCTFFVEIQQNWWNFVNFSHKTEAPPFPPKSPPILKQISSCEFFLNGITVYRPIRKIWFVLTINTHSATLKNVSSYLKVPQDRARICAWRTSPRKRWRCRGKTQKMTVAVQLQDTTLKNDRDLAIGKKTFINISFIFLQNKIT